MKKKQWLLYLAGVAALVALALWARGHIHFQWSVFRDQIRHLNWALIVLGVGMIYLGYVFRALRWARLMRPQKRVSAFSLLGSQVIGFTGVALFGRLADLVRPYLVARRTQLSLTSQVGVYTVERMFDLASMALIFAAALRFAPGLASLPHHETLEHAALLGLLVAIALGMFAVAVRIAGRAVAGAAERILAALSPKLAGTVAGKILAFRDGLNAVGGVSDFLLILVVSLAMWGMIVVAYLATMRSFLLSPQLSNISLARVLVLMAVSMAGSIIFLPVVGWFTQIAFIATTMTVFFNVPSEPALGCAAMLLVVTFLSVVPIGLLWARFEHISVKRVSEESEMAAEETSRAPA